MRWMVPEVIQTSAMDCGPACLKAVCEGFGQSISYGRLREACHTDVDGTSIDAVETVAREIGLEAEQVMIPADYVFDDRSHTLPAIIVTRQPGGVAHFEVMWRRCGEWLQTMNPAVGRRWATRRYVTSRLFIHQTAVPIEAWRAWAESDAFLDAIRLKLRRMNVPRVATQSLVATALDASGWHPLAALEAAMRLVEALIRRGGVKRGAEAVHLLKRLVDTEHGIQPSQTIPADYWSLQPLASPQQDTQSVLFRGAVLVHLGRRVRRQVTSGPEVIFSTSRPSPLLAAALKEPPPRPGQELITLLRSDGMLTPIVLVAALALATAGVITEAIVFRALLDVRSLITTPVARAGALLGVLALLVGLLLLDLPIMRGLLRMGRHLEARLRMAFQCKIPRLGDRYFHSRLISDLVQRCHSVHRIRLFPDLGGQLIRSVFELLATTSGILWLDPGAARILIPAAVATVLVPLAAHPWLSERDLRFRTHTGALSRFQFDALLGLVPLKTHGAGRALRREHEQILVEWGRAGIGLQRLVVAIEGVQFLVGFSLAAWLLIDHFQRIGAPGSDLLLVYWALSLPVIGTDLAQIVWQYPVHRNVMLRLMEPLGAPADDYPSRPSTVNQIPRAPARLSAAIDLQDVTVVAGGQPIVEGVNLALPAGAHLAVVGPSGAGKSTLVGVLLGWHAPAAGRVLIDGEEMTAERLTQLRRDTAWVEPGVQLWNRSLLDNLQYGAASTAAAMASVMEQCGLREVIERLPEGLLSHLGEGGALVSGGEGQRIRLARAMLRGTVRLVILDEPFRGLDREDRRMLLFRARAHWQHASLMVVTHDIEDTLDFDRVVVMDQGRVIEQGEPRLLVRQSGSRYCQLLEAEDAVRSRLWNGPSWRHLRMRQGKIIQQPREVSVL